MIYISLIGRITCYIYKFIRLSYSSIGEIESLFNYWISDLILIKYSKDKVLNKILTVNYVVINMYYYCLI